MSNDLITASDIKNLKSISGTADDATWGLLAAAISAAVRRECGKDFVADTRTEYIDGSGKEVIWPTHTPISSVTSLVDTVNNITYAATDFVIYTRMIRLKNGKRFLRGLQNLTLVYTAGEAPEDVKRAAELIAVHWFHRRHTVGKTSDGGAQGSQVTVDKSDIPPEAQRILNLNKSTSNFFDTNVY
jgi:hypothetical protein